MISRDRIPDEVLEERRRKHEWSDLNNQHRIGVIHKKVGSIEEEIGGEAHGGAGDS